MGSGCSSDRSRSVTVNEKSHFSTSVSVRPVNLNDIPTFKVVLIGDPGAGKTSVFLRYSRNQFDHNYRPTKKAYVENIVKKVNVPGNTVASVALWDLPSREDMDLRESYYRNVDAAIVVVDMTDSVSIEMAATWKQDFVNKVSRCGLAVETRDGVDFTRIESLPCDPKQVPVLLLGNKYDLIEEEMQKDKLAHILANPISGFDEEGDADDRDSRDEETGEIPRKRSRGKKKSVEIVDGRDSEREFTPQRGPKAGEHKPECVKQLERVERDHRFVGSIIVSAKDTDNSVHAAVQSLIRYLLEGCLPPRLRAGVRKSEDTPVETEDELRLTRTEVIEIDEVGERCYVPMRRATDYLEYYQLVLKKFKQTCADMGFLTEYKASLEDCIIGLRDALKNSVNFELTTRDDENFLQLCHPDSTFDVKIPREILIAVKVFNVEYAPLCKAILRDCPTMSSVLTKLDSKIARKSEHLDTLMLVSTEKDRARVLYLCERNRARIAVSQSQITECLQLVRAAYDKVKHALMW